MYTRYPAARMFTHHGETLAPERVDSAAICNPAQQRRYRAEIPELLHR
ncbi:hypothetical protein [Mycolicibacterium tusciae]|nr:hypothetical protein [Mycolicibacterium tusciae]